MTKSTCNKDEIRDFFSANIGADEDQLRVLLDYMVTMCQYNFQDNFLSSCSFRFNFGRACICGTGESLLTDDEIAPFMSFEEAMNLALNGYSTYAVVDAIRYKLAKSQKVSPFEILRLRLNLAVAMMDCAHQSPIYEVYSSMYRESEDILRSILKSNLKIEPTNQLARSNLDLLLNNKRRSSKFTWNQTGNLNDILSPSVPSQATERAQAISLSGFPHLAHRNT
jgi:hypothetical protein